jgi:hypothetical protein
MNLQDVLTALRNADAAGDIESARRLAQIANSISSGMGQYDAKIADIDRRLTELKTRKEEPEITFFGGVGEFFKGIPSGAIGMVETAALGASALLSDENEQAAREKIKEIAGVAKKPFEAAPGYEDSTSRKFSEALGSTAPFFLLGPAGVAGRVAAGGLGAAAGAGEARERAFEAGATAEERAAATGLGTLVGTTEILPVFKFIDNLGKPLTDGIVSRLRRVAATGGAEGLQEASAQIAQNLIEKGIYNPEAGVFTGSGEALGYGAGVGGLIQALTDMALGRRQAKARRADEERQAVAAEEQRRAPVGPTEAAPQGELFPVELQEAQAATQDMQGPQPPAAPEEVTPAAPIKDERQLDLIDLLEEQQIAELDRVQKMEPIVGAQNEAEVKRIQERNAAELDQARLKFESDLAELDGRIQAKEQKTAEEKRLSILLPIVEAEVPGNIPKLFVKALKAEGIRDAKLTDRERALIDRIYSFREATPIEPTPTPVSPETEQLQSLIPERKETREPEQLGIPGIGKREAPAAEEAAPAEPEFPTVLTPEVLDKTGLPRQSGFYRQLLNKDMADPEQQPLVADILQRVRANPNVKPATKEAIENIAGQAFGALSTQQEMFGPRGGVLAPEGGKRARAKKPEPAGAGVSPEGDVGGVRTGRGEPAAGGAETTAAFKESGLDGGRKPAKSDRKTKGKQPTALTFPERALMKEFEDAMAGEIKEVPKKTEKAEGAAKKTEPGTAERGGKRTDKDVGKKPTAPKPKAAPTKKTETPTATKAAKDVEKELTPAQKQAVDNYLGVANGNLDKALEYLAGDLYYGSHAYFDAKKNEYTQFEFGRVGELLPGTGGRFGKRFFETLSDADRKKVMDKVAKFRVQEREGKVQVGIMDAQQLEDRAFKGQVEDYGLEISQEAVLTGPMHPAAVDAVNAGDLKKALGILGDKMDGPMGTAAQKLAEKIGDTKVEVVKGLKNEAGKPVPGLYDPKTDTIKLDAESGMVPHVLLHEATHAETSHVLENKGHPVTKQLTQLYNDVKDSLDTAYGAESLDEFVAEAFSNPEFQGKLNAINPKGGKITAWQRFSNTITNFLRRMMGLDSKPIETAQDRADRLIQSILSPAPGNRNAGLLYAASLAQEGDRVLDRIADRMQQLPGMTEERVARFHEFFSGSIPNTLKNFLRSVLPLNALVDISQKYIPMAKRLDDLVGERAGAESRRNTMIEPILKRVETWAKANPDLLDTFNNVVYNSTLDQVDPSKPRSTYEKDAQKLKDWDALQADWRKLGSEGQSVYNQMRDTYDALYKEVKRVIDGRIDDSLSDKQLASKVKTEIYQKLFASGSIEPYFPLTRSGKYWLSYHATDPRTNTKEFFVEAFETARERDNTIKQLKTAGAEEIQKFSNLADISYKKAPPTSFVNSVLRTMEVNKVDNETIEEVMRLFLNALPETSFAQSFRKRKGVPGFQRDAIGALRMKTFSMSRQLSNMEYGNKLEKLRTEMREHVTEEGNDEVAVGHLGELEKRIDFAVNPNIPRWAQLATSFGFNMTLGFNISSALVNLSQIPLVVMPYLGAKYGYAETTKAIGRATRIFTTSGFDREVEMLVPTDKGEKKAKVRAFPSMDNINFDKNPELKHLKTLSDLAGERGQLNRSIVYDVLDVDDSTNMLTKVNAASGFIFHHGERMNRQVAMIAAYELELARLKKQGKTGQAAEQEAANYAIYVTELTNGGTVAAAAPRIAQSGLGKVLFMFKRYGVSMYYMLFKTARDALKSADPEVRKQAKKQIAGIYASSALLAGVQGIPLFGVAAMIYNMFADDDEDDFNTAARKWMGELFYTGLGNNVLGIEVASRMGLADLIFRDNLVRDQQSVFLSAMEMMGGPVFGVASRMERGLKLIGEGNVERGVEQMLPSAIGNGLKSIRFGTEGAQTLRGDPIVGEFGPWNVFAQGIGFAPAEYTRQLEINSRIKKIDRSTNENRTKLLRNYYTALRMGDREEAMDTMQKIVEFNRKHPSAAITGQTIQRSMAQHAKTSATMYHGITISKNMRPELMRNIAEYDDGLDLFEE